MLAVKVAQIYRKLEELERDHSELRKLLDRISSERDYSDFLKKSFHEEISKVENQIQSIIETKVVHETVNYTNEKTTGDVKKLYALNEKKLSPAISVENLAKDLPKQEQTLKQSKPKHQY